MRHRARYLVLYHKELLEGWSLEKVNPCEVVVCQRHRLDKFILDDVLESVLIEFFMV